MLAATILLLFATQSIHVDEVPSPKFAVSAYSYQIPAPRPCNLNTPSADGFSFTVCRTGPETHWGCAETSRVLVQAENGKRYCLKVE